MSIEKHFQATVIEKNDAFLNSDESDILRAVLERLLPTEERDEGEYPVLTSAESALDLAMLAFVAGRSERAETAEGNDGVWISKTAAGRLIEYLTGGDAE